MTKNMTRIIWGALALVFVAGIGYTTYTIRRLDAQRAALESEMQMRAAQRIEQEAIREAEAAARLEALLAKAQEEAAIIRAADEAKAAARAAAAEANAGETITKDEDGNVTIQPNWNTNPPPPQDPVANMTSGGGEMTVDENETFHGDQPSTPTVGDNTPSGGSTGGGSTTTPPSTQTPSGSGNSGNGGNPGGPSGSEPKSGTISEDGTKKYLKGFGWVEIGPGGSSEPSKGDSNGLSGEKIGDFGGGD